MYSGLWTSLHPFDSATHGPDLLVARMPRPVWLLEANNDAALGPLARKVLRRRGGVCRLHALLAAAGIGGISRGQVPLAAASPGARTVVVTDARLLADTHAAGGKELAAWLTACGWWRTRAVHLIPHGAIQSVALARVEAHGVDVGALLAGLAASDAGTWAWLHEVTAARGAACWESAPPLDARQREATGMMTLAQVLCHLLPEVDACASGPVGAVLCAASCAADPR